MRRVLHVITNLTMTYTCRNPTPCKVNKPDVLRDGGEASLQQKAIAYCISFLTSQSHMVSTASPWHILMVWLLVIFFFSRSAETGTYKFEA